MHIGGSVADEPVTPDPNKTFDENVDWDPAPLGDLGINFDVSAISDVPPIVPPKPEKRRWWQSKKKAEEPEASKPKKKSNPKREPKGGLQPAIEKLYVGVAIGLMPIRPAVARAIMDNAEECAEALTEYANTNPAFKRFLINFVSTSDLGKVIIAHAPIMFAVMLEVPGIRKWVDEKASTVLEKNTANQAEAFANGLFPFSGFFPPREDKETDE